MRTRGLNFAKSLLCGAILSWVQIPAPVWAQAAQTAQAAQAAQAAGLPPEWEVRQQLADLVSQTERLAPLVEKIEPAKWQDAPEAYVGQKKSILDQIGYTAQVVNALSRQPERATLALDVYFRLQTLESQVISFADGIRRYQNPAVADLLIGLTNQTAGSRERLREYLKDLVAIREQERDLLEKEAQRCRSLTPLPTGKSPSKPNGGL